MIYHTSQAETSHSRLRKMPCIVVDMYDAEVFRANHMAARKEADISAAGLSKKAGLNPRAVTDIEEGRAQSPKLSTVFALCEALGKDPGEMIGLGPRVRLNRRLADYLAQYDEEIQLKILDSLAALPIGSPRAKQSQ